MRVRMKADASGKHGGGIHWVEAGKCYTCPPLPEFLAGEFVKSGLAEWVDEPEAESRSTKVDGPDKPKPRRRRRK